MATGEDTVRRESCWSACVTWRDGAVCQLRRKEPVERERKYPAASFWSGCPTFSWQETLLVLWQMLPISHRAQLPGPIFPSGCEGKLGVALESLQGLRDLT